MSSYRASSTLNTVPTDHSVASSLPRSSSTRTSHLAYRATAASVPPSSNVAFTRSSMPLAVVKATS